MESERLPRHCLGRPGDCGGSVTMLRLSSFFCALTIVAGDPPSQTPPWQRRLAPPSQGGTSCNICGTSSEYSEVGGVNVGCTDSVGYAGVCRACVRCAECARRDGCGGRLCWCIRVSPPHTPPYAPHAHVAPPCLVPASHLTPRTPRLSHHLLDDQWRLPRNHSERLPQPLQ